jgi:hypothetical protein
LLYHSFSFILDNMVDQYLSDRVCAGMHTCTSPLLQHDRCEMKGNTSNPVDVHVTSIVIILIQSKFS